MRPPRGGALVSDASGKRPGRIGTGNTIAKALFGNDGRTLYMASQKLLARVPLKLAGIGFQR